MHCVRFGRRTNGRFPIRRDSTANRLRRLATTPARRCCCGGNSKSSHPPPLAGGVKIRASEFLGGGGTPSIIVISPPPATASRSHPPPQAAEGKNSFFVKKRIPIPAKAGISPTSNCFGRDVKRQLEIRGDSRFRGNGRGGGNGREGENGRETGGGNGRVERQKNPSRLSPRNCKTNAMPLKTITHWRQNFCGQKFRPSAP